MTQAKQQNYQINDMLSFTVEQEKIEDDLIIVRLSANNHVVFMYTVETNDSEKATQITIDAFVLMLREKFKYAIRQNIANKPPIQKTADNFFDELI